VGQFSDESLTEIWRKLLDMMVVADILTYVKVSQLSVEIQDELLFPFSKPLIFLLALTAIYTIGLSTFAVRAVIPPFGLSRGLWVILFGLILTWWLYADRGTRKFKLPFEFEYFVFVAWPIVVPYYLCRRLGWRGLLFGLGIWGLYVVPYLISGLVYAVVQIHADR
jgi:hypothetical protein